MAIIAILVALLFPATKSIFDSSKTARCLSNLNQLRVAASLYSNDHDGLTLPGSFFYVMTNYGIATNSPVWICPADTRANKTAGNETLSYGLNANIITWPPTMWDISTVKMLAINQPDKTVYLCDSDVYFMGTSYWRYWNFRHKAKINVLF